MNSRSFTLNGRFLLQAITGVQRVAREVLKELDRLAQDGEIEPPKLLLPANGDIIQPPTLQAIQLKRVGQRNGHAWEQLDLPAYCKSEPLLCLGNTAPISRLLRRDQPVVTMVHDLSYKYFPKAYNWKFRAAYNTMIPAILRLSDRVVTVSHAEEMSIRKHYSTLTNDRLSFLQNGGISDQTAYTMGKEQALPLASERNYGLYVGSLTRRKNAEGIVGAAVRFLRRYPQMRFVVIGSTGVSFEGFEVEVPNDVADRLDFRGQIDKTEIIYDAYRRARFLLFPSFYEASPLPPIEAMTFGCPVIASRIPSLEERCGAAAIYCNPNDPSTIDKAIDKLTADTENWQDISDRSRMWVEQFTWRGQTSGLLKLIRDVS